MTKAVLDDATASDLPPADKGKRSYLYDALVPGFGIAVTERGTKTFFLYRKIGGVPKRITLGHFPHMTVEAARQRARAEGNEEQAIAKPIVRSRRGMFYMGIGALAAAACLAALLIIGTAVQYSWKSETALQSLISFAIDDHLNHRDVSFHTEDSDELRQALAHQLPFEVEIPRIDPGFKVVGGRAEKIGANSVAYTVWNGKNAHVYSLLQFRRVDFGIDPAERPQPVTPKEMAVKHTPCQTLYWSKGDYGFVLVADHGELLDGVKPEADSSDMDQP